MSRRRSSEYHKAVGQGNLFDDSGVSANCKDIGDVASSTADDQAPTVETELDADNDNTRKVTAVTQCMFDVTNQAQAEVADYLAKALARGALTAVRKEQR